jgi:IS30 family transposase
MKLSQSNIYNIYYLFSIWFSQRSIARHLWNSRSTIARYLEPKAIAENFCNLWETEYDKAEVVSVATFYMKVSIILGIAFIIQTILTIIY